MIIRSYIEDITPFIGKDKIIILKGARQVGKTTIMKTLEQKITSDNKNAKTVFLYADRIDNQEIFSSPSNFINYLKYNFSFPEKYVYVFIDEFQFIKDAGIFLKNIFDEYKGKLQIIVSGSSSLEITKNTEFLTGRAITFYIDRLSFVEYFGYKQNITLNKFGLDKINELKNFYQVFKTKLEDSFLDYLTYGGYPEIVTTIDNSIKQTTLSQIVQTYIEKDIIHFLHIENINAFNNLIKLLSSNIGNQVNINEITNTLNISMQTVNKYLDILEGTFIFSRVAPFFQNVRKEISKMPKIFVEDIGIKNYSLGEIKSILQKIDLGAEVENFVYNELRKKFEKRQIYYYRTISKAEIDFVVEKSYKNYILIESKYRTKVSGISVVMKNFEKDYGNCIKIIITKDYLEIQDNLYFIPACLFSFITL